MDNKQPATLGIRHIALRVKELRRSMKFYAGVLGFRVEWHPDPKNVYLSSGNDNLALHEASAAPGGTLDHFGLAVSSPEEVDRWADFLKNSGIRLEQEPKTHRDGARSIYFRDPDGNLIQVIFHEPMSKKQS